ncbi:MAG TPA: AbrB/MazE/SpoVT family DNA-binding domain-containing protein [Candidatus Anoxymicrobiaceae bacterium]
MDTATVSSKYQVVIPKKARDALKIKEGDKIVFDCRDGMVVMLPRPRNLVEFARGLGAEVWSGSESGEYLEGERESWQKTSA